MSRIAVAATLLLAAGCGSGDEHPAGTASGTVTFQGQPVAEGMLWIYSTDTAYSNHAEIKDGHFSLPGTVRTGTYTAFFTPIPPAPGSPYDPVKRIGTGNFPPGIPKKYQEQPLSDLKIEIEEGSKEVEIVVPET